MAALPSIHGSKLGNRAIPRDVHGEAGTSGTIIQDALTTKVVLRQGQGKRSISKLEGIVLRQVDDALKGDPKAALAALKMAAQVGLLEAPDRESEAAASLSAGEQEMVEEILSSSGIRKPKLKPRR